MVRDKSNLPFEVTYSKSVGRSQKTSSMKRLAVLLKPQNVDSITSTLRELGLESTIYDVKVQEKKRKSFIWQKG